MKNIKKEINFSDTIINIGILFIIFIIISFLICIYAIYTIPKETTKYIDNMLLTQSTLISKSLETSKNVLSREIAYNTDLKSVNYQQGTVDGIYAEKNLKNLLISIQRTSDYNANYVIYYKEHDITINGNDTTDEYNQWDNIQNEYIALIKSPDFENNKWSLAKINGKYALIQLYNINNVLISSYIYIDNIINSFSTENLGKDSYFFLIDENNIPISKVILELPKNNKIPLFSWSPSPITVTTNIKNMDFKLGAIINDYSETITILKFQTIFLIIIVLIAVFALYMIFYLNNRIVKPIVNFSKEMTEISKDNSYSVITHYKIAELKNASDIMANFIDQINNLKINIYEQTLEKQKVQLDFLSLQIEPHFFLNCLNTIYHMAAIEKFKEIQELSKNISEYLRYIFKNRDEFVTLEMEINHSKKYLDIQKIRYKESFNVTFDISEEGKKEKIPPLIIQTFVENIIKHAIDWEDSIEIYVSGKINAGLLEIVIEDNGDGFNEEVLYKLQNNIDISKGEKSIGITNAIKRISLLYNNNAFLKFYNTKPKGAGIKIVLPSCSQKEVM